MADSNQTPISPVREANKPELTFSAASVEVNQEPVELDSTPVQDHAQLQQSGRRGSKAAALEGLSAEERVVCFSRFPFAERVGDFEVDKVY